MVYRVLDGEVASVVVLPEIAERLLFAARELSPSAGLTEAIAMVLERGLPVLEAEAGLSPSAPAADGLRGRLEAEEVLARA